MKHVKEKDLAHGQWERWCRDEIEITPQHANKFIRIADRFGNRTSAFGLGVDMLALLTSEADDFVSSTHTIPSTGATKTVDEMTVRELREVKAALRAEREARKLAEIRAEKAEDDYGLMCDTLEAVRAEPPRTEFNSTRMNAVARLDEDEKQTIRLTDTLSRSPNTNEKARNPLR